MAVLSESARIVFGTMRTVLDQHVAPQETFEEFAEHLMDVVLDAKMTEKVAYTELRPSFLHAVQVARSPSFGYTPGYLGVSALEAIAEFIAAVKDSKTSLAGPLSAAQRVHETLSALKA